MEDGLGRYYVMLIQVLEQKETFYEGISGNFMEIENGQRVLRSHVPHVSVKANKS